ncbi:MAG: hydrogenase maturation protein [Wenzhouxiangellaceae bacterium]
MMRILLISSAYNSLTQRAHVELEDAGHTVSVELALSDAHMRSAVTLFQPDLIIAPMLTRAIPRDIWQHQVCLIVHPGIIGDRGPSALDWAIMERPDEWGVTVLQAAEEMDAGDIWASRRFPMRDGSKSSLYRREVSEAAMQCIHEAVAKFSEGGFQPRKLDYNDPDVHGQLRPLATQRDRVLDWRDDTDTILRRMWSGDGSPGVLDIFGDDAVYLFGARRDPHLQGEPGELLGQRDGALCIATGDGAIWVSHARRRYPNGRGIKLPAATVLERHASRIPHLPPLDNHQGSGDGWREIYYKERDQVGYLYFDFYNGAMSTEQCHRLRRAFTDARSRPTKVIVLCGGGDFWSNGIHLNEIEAARLPGEEAWANIQAINDLVLEIMTTTTHLIISRMATNAGAGGVTLALAADQVFGRQGVVLNPHYCSMGGLYGSEYWTYLWPRRVGSDIAQSLWSNCLPLSTARAATMGLIDHCGANDHQQFKQEVHDRARDLANDPALPKLLKEKQHGLLRDHEQKPLSSYRREELQRMWQNFFGTDRSFHQARHQFVYKRKPTETPLRLALHRQHDDREMAADLPPMEVSSGA